LAWRIGCQTRKPSGFLARGYIARGGQILDASIVPVPRTHNTQDENKAAKKGKSHSGDTNHMNVDRSPKLVRRYHVSDAALHDSQAVDHLLMQGNTSAGFWADGEIAESW
jgi:hypothetical protein